MTKSYRHATCVKWARLSARTPPHLDQGRYDHLHRLVDDSEAVGVVQPHDAGAHEGEDGHDVVEDLLLQEEHERVCFLVIK